MKIAKIKLNEDWWVYEGTANQNTYFLSYASEKFVQKQYSSLQLFV